MGNSKIEPKKRETILPEYGLPFRRSLLKGIGYDDDQIRKPLVGVVNTWGENNPAAGHMDRLAKAAKAGIQANAGTPIEFCISSLCGGLAAGGPGARYALGYRDVVAAFIEIISEVNYLDALVLLPICDDVVPAHLMAAARLNLPSILVPGGYMPPVRYKDKDINVVDVSSKYVDWKSGNISDDEFFFFENSSCQGFGACPIMGTGNTMSTVAEALGMTLPGNSTTSGSHPNLVRMAYQAGRQVMELFKKNLRPSDILTIDAFHNALKIFCALGGSTNAVLHMPAIAHEAEVKFDIELFDRISREIPLICNIKPSGKYLLNDLDEAGGLPAVIKELEAVLNVDTITVTGNTLGENVKSARVLRREIIYPLSKPLQQMSGIAILKGNLAPGGAIVKPAAVPEDMYVHKGPARVFDSEVAATEALLQSKIASGDVVVIRYLGPRGDPGMRVCGARFLWILAGMPDKKVAVLTDGRFSGSNKGLAVGHVSPGAAVGGPIAVIEEGDLVKYRYSCKSIDPPGAGGGVGN